MNTLEKKIIFSFGVLSIAILAMTIITFYQVNRLTESSRRIQNVFAPSIAANLSLVNEINASLASLRGWILVKNDNFIRQREAAWAIIQKMDKQLVNYSQHWDDFEQVEKMDSIIRDLALFKKYQETIEEDAHTDRRELAIQLLDEKSSPIAHQVIASLGEISGPQKKEMERVFVEEERQERVLINTSLLFIALSIIGSISLGILLTRAVIVPLNREIASQLHEKSQENEHQQERLVEYTQELETLNAELRTSNEELSQFSYRTSHDLRAPLITVRGLAEVIKKDVNDGDYDEVEKNAHIIANHVQKLERLVVDILNLAKAELEITDKEKVSLEEIVSGIRERLKSIYIGNDVRIETDIDASIDVYASKVRLTQVLENLISNAVKYSDTNKPSRFVKISTVQKEEGVLCIVEDNGVGIPDEFTDRVFDMFQRFHPQISYGSGLGMYIIKKHIDKMNGKISFTSSTNGSKFSIELPRQI